MPQFPHLRIGVRTVRHAVFTHCMLAKYWLLLSEVGLSGNVQAVIIFCSRSPVDSTARAHPSHWIRKETLDEMSVEECVSVPIKLPCDLYMNNGEKKSFCQWEVMTLRLLVGLFLDNPREEIRNGGQVRWKQSQEKEMKPCP